MLDASTSSYRSCPTSPTHLPPGGGVDREPPRVAQPVVPDLLLRAHDPDERVVDRDAVQVRLAGLARVDPQDLPRQRPQVLRVVERVAGATAVAGRDVEVAV